MGCPRGGNPGCGGFLARDAQKAGCPYTVFKGRGVSKVRGTLGGGVRGSLGAQGRVSEVKSDRGGSRGSGARVPASAELGTRHPARLRARGRAGSRILAAGLSSTAAAQPRVSKRGFCGSFAPPASPHSSPPASPAHEARDRDGMEAGESIPAVTRGAALTTGAALTAGHWETEEGLGGDPGSDFSKLSLEALKASTPSPHISKSHPFSQLLENAS